LPGTAVTDTIPVEEFEGRSAAFACELTSCPYNIN
jgi:hypothetical protein